VKKVSVKEIHPIFMISMLYNENWIVNVKYEKRLSRLDRMQPEDTFSVIVLKSDKRRADALTRNPVLWNLLKRWASVTNEKRPDGIPFLLPVSVCI